MFTHKDLLRTLHCGVPETLSTTGPGDALATAGIAAAPGDDSANTLISNNALLQQLQQAQASLNLQLREMTGGSGNSALMQAQLQQQLHGLNNGLGVGFSSNYGQFGANNNMGSTLNPNLSHNGNINLGGGGSFAPHFSTGFGSLGNFGAGLSNNLRANLGSNFGNNFGQLHGGNQFSVPSLLEMQRAENILAAMANNGIQNMGQLSSMMNPNQAAILQNRLNSNLSTQHQLLQEAFLNKNQMFTNLATNHGLPNAANNFGSLEQGTTLGKRTRMSDLEDPHKRSFDVNSKVSKINDFKLTAAVITQDDSSSGKSRRKAKSFPVKLMTALLENPNEDAVAWLPDGKSFVVVNPDIFVDTILVKAFKECKYASFVRKLHRWGFVRLTSGTGTDCFHHALFQRHIPDLCTGMICTPRDPVKGNEIGKQRVDTSIVSHKPPSLAGVEKFFRGRPLTTTVVTNQETTKDETMEKLCQELDAYEGSVKPNAIEENHDDDDDDVSLEHNEDTRE
jgi:HSF-type DNA-binding